MNKKISLGAAIALIILTIALTLSVTMVVAMRIFNSSISDLNKRQVMYTYIDNIDGSVRQNYIGDIDESALRAALAKGYMEGIQDPYAAYLTTAQYKQELTYRSGKLTGFGIEVAKVSSGDIVVTTIYPDSAANRAGLQKSDVITEVDGTAVAQVGLAGLRAKLSTAEKIILTFRRAGESKAVNLSANEFTLTSVEGRMIGSVGYVRIRSFHENTLEQFKSAYAELEAQEPSGYIFDLRNNEGGTLASAKDIIAYLMPRGTFARTTDKKGKETNLSAEDNYQMTRPSYTLVNARTAGEAELFAGVLQEFEKTTLLGKKTAGRGLIQQYYSINADGSAIKLSVSAMSLIKGGPWEGVGLTPSKDVALSAEQEANFELLTDDKDAQLQGAILLLRNSANAGGNAAEAVTTAAATSAETTASSTTTTAAITTKKK